MSGTTASGPGVTLGRDGIAGGTGPLAPLRVEPADGLRAGAPVAASQGEPAATVGGRSVAHAAASAVLGCCAVVSRGAAITAIPLPFPVADRVP